MIILCIIILFLVALSIWCTKLYVKEKGKMSFYESMSLLGLPVVTFYQGDKKLHFLLDTGSNFSVLNKDILNKIQYKEVGGSDTMQGLDGIEREVSFVEASFSYKDKSYKEKFQVTPLTKAFKPIKKELNVDLMGILGNSFFVTYKYMFDFDNATAYPKNKLI